MTKQTPVEIIAGIEPWRNAQHIHIEPLNGGFSNDTYKVEIDGEWFALRINGQQNDFLGLDRREEVQAVSRAYQLGIAPEPLYCSDRSDVLITRFLPGRMLKQEDAHNPEMIAMFADLLHKIHQIKGVERQMDAFDMIWRYLRSAEQLGVAFPDGLDIHLRRLEEIQRERSLDRETTGKYCHNDFFTFNMIYDGQTIRMVDWELSGVGDIFLDLAAVPYTNQYGEEQERCLLRSYFGFYDDDLLRTLHQMKYVSLIREIAWALLHAAIVKNPVNHNMDYMGFVRYVLSRLDGGHLNLT